MYKQYKTIPFDAVKHTKSVGFQYPEENHDECQTMPVIIRTIQSLLTDLEFQILLEKLINPNKSLRQIAASQGVSYVTVHNKIKRIKEKCPCFTRVLKQRFHSTEFIEKMSESKRKAGKVKKHRKVRGI